MEEQIKTQNDNEMISQPDFADEKKVKAGKVSKADKKNSKLEMVENTPALQNEQKLAEVKQHAEMSPEMKRLYGSGTAHLLDENSDGLTRFLAGSYNQFVYRCRYILFFAFVVIGIASVYGASKMGPLTKGEEMMDKEMQVIRTQDIMLDVFDTGLGTPSTLSVQVTWGVKELDRS